MENFTILNCKISALALTTSVLLMSAGSAIGKSSATVGTSGSHDIGIDTPSQVSCHPKIIDYTDPVITINNPVSNSTSAGSYIKIEADVEDPESAIKKIHIHAKDLQSNGYTLVKTFEYGLGNSYSLTYYFNPESLGTTYYDIRVTAENFACFSASDEVLDVQYTYLATYLQPDQTITPTPQPTTWDEFGWSVAMDEIDGLSASAIVGAPLGGNNLHPGTAYILEKAGNNWSQVAQLNPNNPQIWDDFGAAVAIASNSNDGWAFVGAPGRNDKGAVFVFRRGTGGNWALYQTLAPNGLATNAHFGGALSLHYYVASNPSRLAVGAPGSAEVYLYEYDTATHTWVEAWQQAITGNLQSNFGQSVLMYYGELFVGAPDETVNGVYEAGAVYVYNASGVEQARLTANQPGQYDHIGDSLARVDVYPGVKTILAGAPDADIDGNQNQGAVYVFKSYINGWTDATERQKITAAHGVAGDRFGYALTNGRYPYVGVPFSDGSAPNQGAVHQLIQNTDETFSQYDEMYLSSSIAGHRFGLSLATGETLMVGAPNCLAGSSCTPSNLNPGTVYWFDM